MKRNELWAVPLKRVKRIYRHKEALESLRLLSVEIRSPPLILENLGAVNSLG